METLLARSLSRSVESAYPVEILKGAYNTERNVLITPNEYKILQQTALDTSYLILSSFNLLSGKTEMSSQRLTVVSDKQETCDQIKTSRATKRKQTVYIELFNSDFKTAMNKMVEEGFFAKDDQ